MLSGRDLDDENVLYIRPIIPKCLKKNRIIRRSHISITTTIMTTDRFGWAIKRVKITIEYKEQKILN